MRQVKIDVDTLDHTKLIYVVMVYRKWAGSPFRVYCNTFEEAKAVAEEALKFPKLMGNDPGGW